MTSYLSISNNVATSIAGGRMAATRFLEEDDYFYVIDLSDATIQCDHLHFDAQGVELYGKRVYDKLMEIGIW